MVLAIKECVECKSYAVLWMDTPFGDRLTANQRRRLERGILRRLYTEVELELKRQARSAWLKSGRQGHASGCMRERTGRGLVETSQVAVAWATRFNLVCPGCQGVFVEYD